MNSDRQLLLCVISALMHKLNADVIDMTAEDFRASVDGTRVKVEVLSDGQAITITRIRERPIEPPAEAADIWTAPRPRGIQ